MLYPPLRYLTSTAIYSLWAFTFSAFEIQSESQLEPINGTINYRTSGHFCVQKSRSECVLFETPQQCYKANLPYLKTSLDITNHSRQKESMDMLSKLFAMKYLPQCWAVMQPFLCSVMFPKCETTDDVNLVFLPSMEMCQKTMEPCKVLYEMSDFPEFLRCNATNFPSKCNNDVLDFKFNSTGECLPPLVPTNNSDEYYKDFDGCKLELNMDRKEFGFSWLFASASISVLYVSWVLERKYLVNIGKIFSLCCMLSLPSAGMHIFVIPQNVAYQAGSVLVQGEQVCNWSLVYLGFFHYFLISTFCWLVVLNQAFLRHLHHGNTLSKIKLKTHLTAWLAPLVLTVSMLAAFKIDNTCSDGICMNHWVSWLFISVPVPCFLITLSYYTVRSVIRLIKMNMTCQDILTANSRTAIRVCIGILIWLLAFMVAFEAKWALVIVEELKNMMTPASCDGLSDSIM